MSRSNTISAVTSPIATLSPLSRRARYAAGVTLLLTIAACGSDPGGVPWQDYARSLHSTIDALAENKDCTGLQEQFDTADANNDITKARMGHNNAELMKYIDAKMRLAGCY